MVFILYHMTQMLALGFDWGVEKPFYRRKTLLVVGGTRTPTDSTYRISARYRVLCISLGSSTHDSDTNVEERNRTLNARNTPKRKRENLKKGLGK